MANQYRKYVDRIRALNINEAWMHVENGLLPFGYGRDSRRHMTPLECVEAGGESERLLEDLVAGIERKSK